MKKILFFLIIIFFNFKSALAIDLDNLSEATEELEKVQEEISNIKANDSDTAKSIDDAVKEINKATDFVKETLKNNNIEDAINTLEFIEKSLGDVTNLIPPKIKSDMSQIDTEAFGEDKLADVLSVTKAMNVKKEETLKDLVTNMSEIQTKGLNVKEITSNLKDLGIETIEIKEIDVAKIEEMEKWDKNQWANSYTGSILTSTGDEVITDKEISSKVSELESKFQENTLTIENKRIELSNLNNELDPINSELNDLNDKKTLLTSQYNLEISKLSAENLSNLETQKSIELSEKLKNELENVTSEVLKTEEQSALLQKEISSLNSSLNEQILQSNKIREDINSLNGNKLELTETIALKSAKLNELKGQSSSLSSNSNITELTAKLEESEQLKSELTNLQSEIEKKNLTVSQKVSEINDLNTKLNPLADEINLLKERKDSLQKQYNSELTNISNSFNIDDLSKSKELAENLNSDINSVTDEIKKIEASSSEIQSDISKLNFEINTEKDTLNKISIELANSQKELNLTNDIIDSKELELDRLLNTDLAQNNQKLNQQLNQVSLQKDFIQSQFEKSIDLEVDALQRYHTALGDTAEEIDFAMREVGVILDSDPRKARAFDIEKYATYAGLSSDFIQTGINAVNNDDWDAQKNIYKDITKALAKSPNWVVDVPSEAEFRVMIVEEKAIQEAALASLEIENINREWSQKINEQVKDIQPLAALSTTTIQYAVTWEGMAEHEFLTNEFNKVVAEAGIDFNGKVSELNVIQKEYNDVQQWLQQANSLKYNNPGSFTAQMNAEYSKKYYENLNLNKDYWSLRSEINNIENNSMRQARTNLLATVEEAKTKYNEIISQENKELTVVKEKVSSILQGVPTFEGQADSLAGLDATTLRARLVDLTNGSNNETEALEAARKAMSEMGETPVSEYMTGPYWEMSNVKAAAIVRSKKYDYVDDFEYINAYYRDPLQLNTSQRQEVESELKNILGNNNPKLNALTKQANSLKSEIETNNVQLSNINSNISKLENEISSIKSSEENLKNQISKLNNDLTSKQSIIDGKNKSLTDLQKNMDPINNKISELETKKNDLNNNIQNQINLISQNTQKSEEITQKTLELENKLSKELSEIDQQINGYKKETEQLTVNISTLNNEISTLESDKPDLSSKISKINEELTGYANVKAELSLLNTEQKVEVENLDVEINKLEKELSDLKSSEGEINQQLASLSNELQQKENIIKNNNLSITEIKKQLDPLNNQIESLESQKITINDQFNKDLAELSSQIEKTTEASSSEIDKLKANFESEISKLNNEINNFETQAKELNSTVTALNDEIKSIEVETPKLSTQITQLNQDIKDFTNIKADLAIAEARKANMDIEDKLVSSIAQLENKSIIKISGSNTLRIVDTNLLTDNAGNFKIENTLTVNGSVYTAGAVQPQQLFSFESIDETGDMKIEYSKEALAQLSEVKEIGGTTQTSGSTVGSWVLVDAKTGKQMANPNNGHQGSIVCDLGTCGSSGSFGKEAAGFGGVYVLENLADPITGNVAGRCAGGDCQFNFSNSNMLSTDANMISAETTQISKETKASIDASRAVVTATQEVTTKTLTGTTDLASNVVEKLQEIANSGLGNNSGNTYAGGLSRLQQTIKEINQSQAAAAAAVASGTADVITNAMSTQSASSAIAGALARDMVQGASNEVNTTSQQLRQATEAVASAASEAQKAAAEAQQATAQAAADAAREALNAAQAATQEIQQAARAAQEAAGDVVAGISGSDLEALRQLPNDALGVWQLVDAQGKAVNDQQIVCNISSCGAGAAWAAEEHAKGNSYVRTNRTGGY
jgi:chromosome segregation ATPase